MLLGYHKRTIDPKGRMILPREFRDEFAAGLVVTKGLDRCLLLYPMKEWENIVSRVNEMPEGSEATRKFTRLFFSSANQLIPDGQGRVLIPPHLRAMADLGKDVVVVGLSNKAEVWNDEYWREYSENSSEQFEQSASEIGF